MVKISVIIPSYGEPIFLRRTISSVLEQSYKNIEVIVVDDNNPDTEARIATEKIIDLFSDERLQYVKHPQNLNGAVARNTGISYAKGEYIAFLDSDDEYMQDRLEKCLKVLENTDSSVAGVYTGCEFRRSGEVYYTHTDVKDGNFLLETLACTFMFCTGSNIFIKKSVIDEICGFDGAFLRHQDYEFLVRIFEKYSLVSIPEVLVVKNNENVNLPNVRKIIDIKKQYLDKYKPIIEKLTKKEKDYIYHNQYLQIAEAALRTKDFKTANYYYNNAKKYGGLKIKEQLRRVAFVTQNLIKK